MRGKPDQQLAMLTSLSTEDLIPGDHPIRRIRRVVDEVLAELDSDFDAMYSGIGRPSVPPEQLLKATILMAMYSVRSERAFCERLNYDLLFKWFLDLSIDAKAFDPTTFTKNRDRLLDAEVADRFFAAVVRQAALRRYVSSDHFAVDGTLLEAWASHKSFKPNTDSGTDDQPGDGPGGAVGGRNVEVDWRGQPRSNQTHRSTTDPEALLARKGNTPARLCYSGHLLIENRNALVVDAELTAADGYAERATALDLLARLPVRARRRTVAADKAYDTRGFVAGCRALNVTPHVAQNTTRQRSAIDGRTTRHPGHRSSQRARPRVEEPFGWLKTIAGGRKLRYRGRARNRAWFLVTTATYNLLRITALDAQPA
ncbi:IS5 family transposase [Iamia sp. SCSIO 61187]|uniref:IS5 family transposase n=1 Tax=Iamia sp. SCSIO 61187 TaxID=2722752 RepID=UPI001C6288CE|nr:IS5 family transposase [Iamia sp. SCSIO 61187]QYG91740.1 IS5 family transposase [Iamia sp. SCSIO 61187]